MSETDLAFINRIDKQNSFMAVSPDHERLRNLAWRGVRAAEDMELVRSQNAALRAENENLRAALEMFACDCEGKAICFDNCMHRNARAALGDPENTNGD